MCKSIQKNDYLSETTDHTRSYVTADSRLWIITQTQNNLVTLFSNRIKGQPSNDFCEDQHPSIQHILAPYLKHC